MNLIGIYLESSNTQSNTRTNAVDEPIFGHGVMKTENRHQTILGVVFAAHVIIGLSAIQQHDWDHYQDGV